MNHRKCSYKRYPHPAIILKYYLHFEAKYTIEADCTNFTAMFCFVIDSKIQDQPLFFDYLITFRRMKRIRPLLEQRCPLAVTQSYLFRSSFHKFRLEISRQKITRKTKFIKSTFPVVLRYRNFGNRSFKAWRRISFLQDNFVDGSYTQRIILLYDGFLLFYIIRPPEHSK